jgi:DNA-binding SARP family transcriptional activator
MEFRILGPLEALDGKQRVTLGGSKLRAVLALLLLHPNETVSSDQLIDELWGEEPPATAAKALQVHVSRLRKALAGSGGGGGDVVVTRPHGYQLQIDLEQLDSHRFERLLAEGRRELASDRPERALPALEQAVSLWRGPPLADLTYEPFARTDIARLEQLRLAALEERIAADLALGRHADVVGELEALVADYPLRERPRGQLMLALYRSGRQAEALEAYRRTRSLFVEDLGIEPGRELQELEHAILQQDRSLDLGALISPERGPAHDRPVAGPEQELAELLQDAARTLLLIGEALATCRNAPLR